MMVENTVKTKKMPKQRVKLSCQERMHTGFCHTEAKQEPLQGSDLSVDI